MPQSDDTWMVSLDHPILDKLLDSAGPEVFCEIGETFNERVDLLVQKALSASADVRTTLISGPAAQESQICTSSGQSVLNSRIATCTTIREIKPTSVPVRTPR